LKFTRQRYQRGYLRRVPRANNKSAWEYRYADPQTGKEKSMYFSTEQFPTQTAVERHLETFVLKLNTDNPTLAVLEPTFDTLLDRFIEEERLLEIKKVRPGESCDNVGELSFSTASSYLSVIKRVRAKWGTTRITRLKPMNVQEWLRNLEAAPKTKGHIKAVIHRLYEKAMLWEMVEWQRNPMEFVEIKGISKRRKRPVILTVEQFFLILPLIPQPYRMMALLAQCSGLRVEEVLAIEKPDIHFGKLSMQIVRAVVHGRLKLVKTEYSEDELPLDPDLAAILLDFIREAEREALAKLGGEGAGIIESDLLFVSPMRVGISTRRQSGRTTSVLLVAAWIVRTVGPSQVSGARPTFPFLTGNAYRCTMSGGMLPASTAASGGTPSAIPTGLGWTTPEHLWECSRN
jgi:integrase